METIAIRILQLVMSLSLLIVVHEFGHFLFAKLFKVRVEKFCLFFDPWLTLLKFPKRPREGQTQYCLGWLPLGGYVKIAGMIDESLDREQMARPPQPWEFRTKPAWQRLLIMVGGVVFNFLLAIVIYIMILFTWGETRLVATTPELGLDFSPTALSIGFCNGDKLLEADGKPIADEATSLFVPRRNGYYRNVDLLRTVANARVVKVERDGHYAYIHISEEMGQRLIMDSVYFASYRYPVIIDSLIAGPAKDAGLTDGDHITALAGIPTAAVSDLRHTLDSIHGMANAGDTITVAYTRAGVGHLARLAPDTLGRIGILMADAGKFMKMDTTEFSLLSSIPGGTILGVNTLKSYVSDFKYVFTKEGAKSLGGFGTIASIFPELWDWQRFWEMTAFLSVILAFMNILPIPALDGGHVLFLLYEMITRRKPSDKFLEMAQVIGMILLLILLVWANFNDVLRLF